MTVQSNVEYIWRSLSKIWQEIRLKGHSIDVSIPVIGADLARTGLPRMALTKLIITSLCHRETQSPCGLGGIGALADGVQLDCFRKILDSFA